MKKIIPLIAIIVLGACSKGKDPSTNPQVLSACFSCLDSTIVGVDLGIENCSKGATSFQWDFGDSTTSIFINPIKVFSKSGDYILSLSTADDQGSFKTEKKSLWVGSSLRINKYIIDQVDLNKYPKDSTSIYQVNFIDYGVFGYNYFYNGTDATFTYNDLRKGTITRNLTKYFAADINSNRTSFSINVIRNQNGNVFEDSTYMMSPSLIKTATKEKVLTFKMKSMRIRVYFKIL